MISTGMLGLPLLDQWCYPKFPCSINSCLDQWCYPKSPCLLNSCLAALITVDMETMITTGMLGMPSAGPMMLSQISLNIYYLNPCLAVLITVDMETLISTGMLGLPQQDQWCYPNFRVYLTLVQPTEFLCPTMSGNKLTELAFCVVTLIHLMGHLSCCD